MAKEKKVAIVTGASRGMGRAIAEKLLKDGCRVCLVSRKAKDLKSVVRNLPSSLKKNAMLITADVGKPASPKKIITSVIRKWKTVHILVNNAGGPPVGTFEHLTDAQWMSCLQTNFLSAVRMTRLAAPHMKRQNWGRIINLTSTIAKEPSSPMVLSAAARAAVSAFAKSISHELAPFGVTVNTVLPGPVLTGRATYLITEAAKKQGISFDQALKNGEDTVPVKRFADPKEVAEFFSFIASEKAAFLTGTSVPFDGGVTKGTF